MTFEHSPSTVIVTMPPLTLAPAPDVPASYEQTNVHQVYNVCPLQTASRCSAAPISVHGADPSRIRHSLHLLTPFFENHFRLVDRHSLFSYSVQGTAESWICLLKSCSKHFPLPLLIHSFPSFSTQPWPTISNFLLTIPPGSIGLDAGCGNGKYLPSFDDASPSAPPLNPNSPTPAPTSGLISTSLAASTGSSIMIGLDRSDNLVALAHRVGFEKEGQEQRVVTKGSDDDDGRRREVMVADVLDLGGVRRGSMVRKRSFGLGGRRSAIICH